MMLRISLLLLFGLCATCERGYTDAEKEQKVLPIPGCLDCDAGHSRLDKYLKSQKTARRIEYLKRTLNNHLPLETLSKNSLKLLNPFPEALVEQILYEKMETMDTEMQKINNDVERKQVILFPDDETSNCDSLMKNSICLNFKLTEDLLMSDITSASLRFNKEYLFFNGTNVENVTVIDKNSLSSADGVKYQRTHPVEENGSWCHSNITGVFKTWQMSNHVIQTLIVACDTCLELTVEKRLLLKKQNKVPFLLLNIEVEKNTRSKRGVDCLPGNNECCRENFEVDFRSLGSYYNAIVHPSKFNAYICRGNCYYHSAVNTGKPYATLLVMLRLNDTTQYTVPAACCTPTKFSGFSVIYATNNNSYVRAEIPNVVVESCGCV